MLVHAEALGLRKVELRDRAEAAVGGVGSAIEGDRGVVQHSLPGGPVSRKRQEQVLLGGLEREVDDGVEQPLGRGKVLVDARSSDACGRAHRVWREPRRAALAQNP